MITGTLLVISSSLVFGSPATASTGAVSASAGQQDAPLQYVALGDSYSAGFGLQPYSESPASGCFQAEANYPHLVAGVLGLDLDDRTCSGAVTANVRDTPQVTITGAGVAPVQVDALSSDTDIVTISIGGNDLGFADVAASCLAQGANGPLYLPDFQNCRSLYVQGSEHFEFDTLKAKLDNTVAPALRDTFALIRAKAPNARVFVVGYPAIAPGPGNVPAGGCFTPMVTGDGAYQVNAFPFTDIDTGYLHQTEVRLDAAIRTAAEGAGATYISTLEQTESHSACAKTDPFISGITLVTSGPSTPTGIPGLSVALGALHPNSAGVGFLATKIGAAVADAIDTLPPTTPTPTPTPAPTSPAPGVPEPGSGAAPDAVSAVPAPDSASRPALANTGVNAVPLGLAGLVVLLGGALATGLARQRRASRR